MKTRREFIQKASISSIAFSTGCGLTFKDQRGEVDNIQVKRSRVIDPTPFFVVESGWKILFQESESTLLLENGPVKISGKLIFNSGNEQWSVVQSRDAIKDRYALVDLRGNVQGYLTFCLNGGEFQICFYHRTAQAYAGSLSFAGDVIFLQDSFACRTKAKQGERVLALSCGQTDSLLNDSLFSPESDSILKLDATKLKIDSVATGTYSISMSGQITESSQAAFKIILENNYFKKRYVPYYQPLNRERCMKTPTGWMSWNTYFDKATAEDNLTEARIGQKKLQPFGCEFWSIESWQRESDQLPVSKFHNMNLEVNEKQFPKGMKQLADDIRELGFRPGLWMAPFGTGNEVFYNEHKNWFLHDPQGKPISSWNGRFMLDPTVPEAMQHLRSIFDTASHDWGYEFFKIDGMSGRSHGYCAHLYERPEIRERFYNPNCPNPFEGCVKTFREGIGEDRIFLACQGHTSGPEARYADAARLGADIVHPNEPVKWTNVLNQARCTINQIFTHNIVMIADPDTLLVHDLVLEEARVSATIVALPGQLTFFGDKLAGLSDAKMKILQQSLPVADVLPVNLYPYFSMLPVWNLQVKNKWLGSYNVVALFNWEDETKVISAATEELGIDHEERYLAFEFWEQKSYGILSNRIEAEVPAHGVRLLAIHRLETSPQWVSSDRHIAQNGLELKRYQWNSELRTLEGDIELIGTFPLTMQLHVPDGFTFLEAKCVGAQCQIKEEKNSILPVHFKSGRTGIYSFMFRF